MQTYKMKPNAIKRYRPKLMVLEIIIWLMKIS